MSDPINVVPARDAFRLSGADQKMWQNTVDRGHYPEAPKGTPRLFGRDDLVALAIFKQLVAIGSSPSGAAHIASSVLTLLRRRKDIEMVYVVAGTDKRGKPSPKVVETTKPGDDVLIPFRVGAYRKQAAADIAQHWQQHPDAN